jgi:cysteine synthase
VVESTAGNTGIGLALVATARGYRTLIVIPETQSQEKKDALRLAGAELVEVPALPYSNPNNYQHVGRRMAEELRESEPDGVLFADQWNNLDNRKAHYVSTGPEIWEETGGAIDGFICAIGTGGTIAGVSSCLRERKPEIAIVWARAARSRSATAFPRSTRTFRSRRSTAVSGFLLAHLSRRHIEASLEAAIEVRKVAEASFQRDLRNGPRRVARTSQHAARSIEPSFEGESRERRPSLFEKHLDIARRDPLTPGNFL